MRVTIVTVPRRKITGFSPEEHKKPWTECKPIPDENGMNKDNRKLLLLSYHSDIDSFRKPITSLKMQTRTDLGT